MVAWKDDGFSNLFLASLRIFLLLHFNEHESTDDFQDRILLEDIVPHIVDTVIVIADRIASSCIYAFAGPLVEWKEEGVRT